MHRVKRIILVVVVIQIIIATYIYIYIHTYVIIYLGGGLLSAPDEGVSGIDGDFDGDLFAVDGIEGFTVSVGADRLSDNVVGEDGS
jgi:hypothetical protein